MYGPELSGERVKLRPHVPEDAAVFVAMFADPRVMRYMARSFPPTLTQELEFLEKRGTEDNSICWTIEVEGRPVGVIGIHQIDWLRGVGVVGTFIGDPALWEQGFATEMGELVRDYVFSRLPFRKLRASYIEPNEGSHYLQKKLGFIPVGKLQAEHFRDGSWHDEVIMELYNHRNLHSVTSSSVVR